jgi:hypothetical protein
MWFPPSLYSFVILISDELKRLAAHRHSPLIFSCVRSLEENSELVKSGKATINVCDNAPPINFAKKTLIIDDYILFCKCPDSLLTEDIICYNTLKQVLFHKKNVLYSLWHEQKYLK